MRGFWTDRKGNVAITFALLMIPIFGAMGVALDYSMASAYRTDMQKALDATALALTKIMPADQATLDTVGNQYFKANLGPNTLTDLQLTVTPQVGVLHLSVKGTYSVQMANLIGATTVDLGARADARWSIGKVEIALVLDNSGSMSEDGKMEELHKAAKGLLNVLENAVREEGDAKVAIIPFDSRVNVGIGKKDKDWIKWDDWDDDNETCTGSGRNQSCEPKNHSEWNGCVWDRDQTSNNYDISDAAPASANSTKYPAWQCDHFMSQYPGLVTEMMPLSTDWEALAARVEQMRPSGYTNITIGLVWGWHALSETEVMTEGVPYDTENLTKYVILLSDGTNTRSRHSSSESAINTRTSSVCTRIKNEDIKIYTIRLISGNASVLRNCATETDMYFDVQEADELNSVFNSIGSQIANLHLSR